MSKLSEEEIIKGITKILNECDKYFDDYGIYLHLAGKDEQDLVQGLLDLYIKEKEKNKLINDVKAIGTNDVVNVVLTKSQYEYLLERATNTFDKYEKCPNCKTNLDY